MTLEWRQRRQHGSDAIGLVEAGERVAGTSTKQFYVHEEVAIEERLS